jgi:uncharacterized membrane protein YqjE
MAQFNPRSIPDVFHDVVGHVQEIFRSELRLLKAEVKQESAKAIQPIMRLCLGGALSLYAGIFGLLTIMFLLSMVLPLWLSALIVTVLLAPVGLILIASGVTGLRRIDPMPGRTVQSLKENVQWAKDQTP